MTDKMIDSYKTNQNETIEMTVTDNLYAVACWDKNDDNRWYKEFDSLEKAKIEFERFRHCEIK